jgi:hypothetical protein
LLLAASSALMFDAASTWHLGGLLTVARAGTVLNSPTMCLRPIFGFWRVLLGKPEGCREGRYRPELLRLVTKTRELVLILSDAVLVIIRAFVEYSNPFYWDIC